MFFRHRRGRFAYRPGLVVRRITLKVTPAARAALATRGYDPRMGARPLRRMIEEAVVTPLAVRMAGDPAYRDREVVVTTAGDAEVPDSPGDHLVV